MPDGIDVMLSIILDKTAQRNGLHVQSRSYWAPANIGPYSQAISIPLPSSPTTTNEATGEVVYIAGQIPLHPASMSPYTAAGFRGQVLLSLQHLWRIGRAKNVTWWTAGVAFIPASIPHPEECVAVARHAWTRLHTPYNNNADADDEDEDVDPWDRVNKNGYGVAFNDATYRAPIPDFDKVRIGGEETAPPCFVVQIESLPRDVDVEWSATGLTASSISFDGSVSSPTGSKSNFHAFAITQRSDYDAVQNIKWASATLYVGRGFTWDEEWTMGGGVQWIPCQRVWGTRGEEVMGVVVGRVDEQET
jgi:diphthine-ammonia ligase